MLGNNRTHCSSFFSIALWVLLPLREAVSLLRAEYSEKGLDHSMSLGNMVTSKLHWTPRRCVALNVSIAFEDVLAKIHDDHLMSLGSPAHSCCNQPARRIRRSQSRNNPQVVAVDTNESSFHPEQVSFAR